MLAGLKGAIGKAFSSARCLRRRPAAIGRWRARYKKTAAYRGSGRRFD
jgi:hypothetical protein